MNIFVARTIKIEILDIQMFTFCLMENIKVNSKKNPLMKNIPTLLLQLFFIFNLMLVLINVSYQKHYFKTVVHIFY